MIACCSAFHAHTQVTHFELGIFNLYIFNFLNFHFYILYFYIVITLTNDGIKTMGFVLFDIGI